MSINDITQAAQRLNEAADAYHGKIADINARIAAKEADVVNFIASADGKYESVSFKVDPYEVKGDPDKYYPVVFSSAATQIRILRHVHNQSDIYGSFNGSVQLEAIYHATLDGGYPGYFFTRAHRQASYSPDVPAFTPQFFAKFSLSYHDRVAAADTARPAIWLRGNTAYQIGAKSGTISLCNGDGIVNERDYGILQSDYAPLVPFTN
ncbi:hypothetical protein HGG67_05600 [Rhodobacteraceae bacterium R_SAG8]|nr:hypothetical protein [Rhodobacteraceae bacterium R_SAG8]